MSEFQLYPIADINLNGTYRDVSEEHVRRLQQSIAEIGLRQPVTVSASGTLLAGRHRFEACKVLNWEAIPAMVSNLSDLQDELWVIDENLLHNPLTAWARAAQVKRRKEIYEIFHPETRQGAAQGEVNRESASLTTLTLESRVSVVSEENGGMSSATQKQRVYAELLLAGEEGLTAEEIEDRASINGNTLRPRLTELEKSGHVTRTERERYTRSRKRARVYIALVPDTPRDPQTAAEAFVTETAEKTGRGASTIWSYVQIADQMVPDVAEQIPGSALENRKTDLLSLARKPEDEQRVLIAEIVSGRAKTLAEAERNLAPASEPDGFTVVETERRSAKDQVVNAHGKPIPGDRNLELPSLLPDVAKVLRRYFTKAQIVDLGLELLGREQDRVFRALERRYTRTSLRAAVGLFTERKVNAKRTRRQEGVRHSRNGG